jgi:hypothetical protein
VVQVCTGTCVNGHDKAPDTWVARQKRGRWDFKCLVCERNAQARYASRKRKKAEAPSMVISLTPRQKVDQYTDAIIRMHTLGLWSTEGAEKALERVRNMG